jgi:hypothetical protein
MSFARAGSIPASGTFKALQSIDYRAFFLTDLLLKNISPKKQIRILTHNHFGCFFVS